MAKHTQHSAAPEALATLPLLHGAMLLSGFGTVFLGPVLPVLARSAGTQDAGSGLFFAAQFVGAFFGGLTTRRPLWHSLIRGCIAAAVGFAAVAVCAQLRASVEVDALALLPLGFGVGQMLTSLNLLASQRFPAARGSALAIVNLSWSLGAVIAPLLLGALLSRVPLPILLAWVSVAFTLALTAALWNRSQPAKTTSATATNAQTRLPVRRFVFFATLLLIYGGTETSLSGWLTTFALRYGSGVLRTSTVGVTALWVGITAGHALVPPLLRRMRERTLLTAALACAAVMVIALSSASGTVHIAAAAALLGVCLAPWFPLVLSALLGEDASAGEVGTIIAVSGLGAATLPLLVGVLSRATGSLRVALLAPFAGLVALLAMSLVRSPQRPHSAPGIAPPPGV